MAAPGRAAKGPADRRLDTWRAERSLHDGERRGREGVEAESRGAGKLRGEAAGRSQETVVVAVKMSSSLLLLLLCDMVPHHRGRSKEPVVDEVADGVWRQKRRRASAWWKRLGCVEMKEPRRGKVRTSYARCECRLWLDRLLPSALSPSRGLSSVEKRKENRSKSQKAHVSKHGSP